VDARSGSMFPTFQENPIWFFPEKRRSFSYTAVFGTAILAVRLRGSQNQGCAFGFPSWRRTADVTYGTLPACVA